MKSKYPEPRPLSGHTQTFQILMQGRLETLPEFKHQPVPKRKSKLQIKSNIFAHILQNLLIPAKKDEPDNFIAKIKPKPAREIGYRLQIASRQMTHDEVRPEIFKQYFRENKAQNLGALTAFNLICSGHLVPGNLIVTQSPSTNDFYFSQGFQEFWADFFDDRIHHVHIGSEHELHDKFMFFIPGDDSWWDTSMPEYDLRSLKTLFLDEFIQLYFRLSLTPMSLLEKIMSKLFMLEDKEEVERFIDYFKNRITWVSRHYNVFFDLSDNIKLKEYIDTKGHDELHRYIQDIEHYFHEFPLINEEEFIQFRLEIMAQAMDLGIANLDHLCTPSTLKKDCSSRLKMASFRYIASKVESEQDSVLQNPTHCYWDLLEEISHLLHQSLDSSGRIDIKLFHIHLFIKAIQYHKHHLASFMLSKNDRLKNLAVRECSDLDPEKRNLEGRTPLTVALFTKNTMMLNILICQGAKIAEIDILFLKEKLTEAIMNHDEARFAFIIQNCPPVLSHLHFEEKLLALCHTMAPEFIKYFTITPPALTPLLPDLPRPRQFSRRKSFTCMQELHAYANTPPNTKETDSEKIITGNFKF